MVEISEDTWHAVPFLLRLCACRVWIPLPEGLAELRTIFSLSLPQDLYLDSINAARESLRARAQFLEVVPWLDEVDGDFSIRERIREFVGCDYDVRDATLALPPVPPPIFGAADTRVWVNPPFNYAQDLMTIAQIQKARDEIIQKWRVRITARTSHAEFARANTRS